MLSPLPYAIFSIALISVGFYGLISRGNFVKAAISLEFIASGVAGAYVFVILTLGKLDFIVESQTLALITLATDAVILGLLIALFIYVYEHLKISDWNELR